MYATLLSAQEMFWFQGFQGKENYINKIIFPISAVIINKIGLHCIIAVSG
jgi:hypothetical protein